MSYRKLLLKGPSEKQRKVLWLRLSGAHAQIRSNPGYYQAIIEERASCSTVYLKQIDRDLHRTFPTEDYLREKSTQRALRNVLMAYTWRNPTAGYCQGFNCIVGRLLYFGFSEEESFWLFTQLIESVLPLDYFVGMLGILTDQKLLARQLRKKFPELWRHLSGLSADVSLFSVQWYICLFSYSLRPDTLVRAWDFLFAEGYWALHKIAFATLESMQREAMQRTDFIELLKLLEVNSWDMTPSQLEASYFSKRSALNVKLLEIERNFLRTHVKLELDQQANHSLSANELYKAMRQPCLEDEDCKMKLRHTASFLILTSGPLQIIEDYVNDPTVPEFFDLRAEPVTRYPLLLGHRSHKCTMEAQIFKTFQRNKATIFLSLESQDALVKSLEDSETGISFYK